MGRVTKRSSLNAFRDVRASGDGFGSFRLAGDLDQPLGGGVELRVNGMYEDDSFRRTST